jgi:sugar phosphate isomerase/epimerase
MLSGVAMNIYGPAYSESDLEFLRNNKMGIEVYSHPPNLRNPYDFDEYHKTITERIRGMKGVSMHGVINDMAYTSGDPLIVEVVKNRFIQSVQAASLHGINSLIFHSSYRTYHGCNEPLVEWYIKTSIDFWKDFESNIPDGMTVLLENFEDENPEVFIQILKGINSPKIRCCFDIGHAYVYSPAPLDKWIRTLEKYIGHVHINDNDGKRDLHLPLGKGNIPLANTINDILNYADEEVPFTLECDILSSVDWLKNNKFITSIYH